MCIVKFKDRNMQIEVENGTKLIDCIREAGLKIETPCNSTGKCGKCKVKAYGELYPKTEEEEKHTEDEAVRLACIAKVKGNVEIELIEEKKDLKTINRGFSINAEIKSAIRKVKLPRIQFKNFLPYKNTLDYKVNRFNLIKNIGIMERKKQEEIYGVVFNEELIDIREYLESPLGVAVDIGTTGLSAYLVNLETGEILNNISSLNPQTEYGGDVLSRISFCMKEEDGIEILSNCIKKKIDSMIEDLTKNDFNVQDIYRVTIAANTTMLHLFLGVNPDSIAKAPYRAAFLDKFDFNAKDFGLNINKEGILTILPSVSSYVGADIAAGVIAVDFQNKKHSSIFIDIGTNGEIVAISKGKMAASSTAAGPALEGMNISCGSRAEEGAIDSFSIDEELNINYTTIGGEKARGICGSGLIDIAAALVKSEIVSSSGRFNKELPEKIKHKLVDKKFYITEDIYISQKDVRQIQLAKGAISSGITMLLKQINVDIKDIDEAVIAGAFGYHINPESIKTISLVPKGFRGEINFVGNSSIEGAKIALINEDKLNLMSEIREGISVVELSTREDFQQYFVEALKF